MVDAADAEVEPVRRYDATRSLAHVTFSQSPAVELPGADAAIAWHIAQALLAAESLGAVEAALEASVAYAKDRFTFGRAIGSYQAVKHDLVEILRRQENARSLMYYAGWAAQDRADEFPLAAASFRTVAGAALDHASRVQISVHGGIGATWEHDAPLYFRRAQLSRQAARRRRRRGRAGGGRAVRGGAAGGGGGVAPGVHVWTHDRWRFPLPAHHRFPLDKYALLRERVVADGTAAPDEVHEAGARAVGPPHRRPRPGADRTASAPAR